MEKMYRIDFKYLFYDCHPHVKFAFLTTDTKDKIARNLFCFWDFTEVGGQKHIQKQIFKNRTCFLF